MNIDSPVHPRIVAERFLSIRQDHGVETTPMHVIKLVYLAHGWGMGWGEGPLINEPVEAWTYGPVVPSLYRTFKAFGRNPIVVPLVDRSGQFTENQIETIKVVEEFYRDYTAAALSGLTHQPSSPWDVVVKRAGYGCIIPNEIIRDYYKRLYEDE